MQSDLDEKYSHKYWIDQTLKLIKDYEKNEVPVCAIIVKNNKLISYGLNLIESLNDSTAHAEIIAIKKASQVISNWRLNDCTIYCTLEPCSMCMGAILNSRISKLIFGAYDKVAGACGSILDLAYELRKEKQIEIIGGICEAECAEILKKFFISRRNYNSNSPSAFTW